MANIEAMIKWMSDRKGKVTYSMDYRNGPNSYDCSSAVYNALIAGGFFPVGTWVGNTDSLYGDLERRGWQRVPITNGMYKVQRGDIFIWGKQGSSGGAFGHTGIFLDANDQMIHCNYGYNGITINDHDTIWHANGRPIVTVYRYAGKQTEAPAETPQSNKWYDETGTFTLGVNELALRGETSQPAPNSPASIGVMTRLNAGQSVKYDRVLVDQNGYVWIRQRRANGKYAYIATGPTANGVRSGAAWGTFK